MWEKKEKFQNLTCVSTNHTNASINKINDVLGTTLQIPCIIRNRQGECLWLHNGKAKGMISGKYEFKREPDNGKLDLWRLTCFWQLSVIIIFKTWLFVSLGGRLHISGDCTITIYNADRKYDDGQWQCQVTAPSVHQETLSSEVANVIVLITPSRPVIKRPVSL